jgi:hypothetical protein
MWGEVVVRFPGATSYVVLKALDLASTTGGLLRYERAAIAVPRAQALGDMPKLRRDVLVADDDVHGAA